MVPQPTPEDLLRDAERDTLIYTRGLPGSISGELLSTLGSWMRRAIAAEAERDKLQWAVSLAPAAPVPNSA